VKKEIIPGKIQRKKIEYGDYELTPQNTISKLKKENL